MGNRIFYHIQPQSAGIFAGQVTVQSDATSGSATISISGTATASGTGILTLSGNLDFGDVVLGTRSPQDDRDQYGDSRAYRDRCGLWKLLNFVLNGLPGLPKVLQPNQSFTCNVYLTAQNVGQHSGTITVQSSAGAKSLQATGQVFPAQSSCPASFTDARDGEVYNAVEFAGKCWMTETRL